MSKVYYKGDSVFLYTQFSDIDGNPCIAEEPQVRVLHDNDGNIYEDLPWTEMVSMSDSEYYFNFTIPYAADLGQYQALYYGVINGQDAYTMETFHVISKSDKYEDTVKLYGYVHDIRTNVPIGDSTIFVINNETGEKISQSLTNDEGYWEAYVYPGVYNFKFTKIDFVTMDINVEIGDEHNEIQFNNIGLELQGASTKGNGIFQVKDKYVTKQGTPLMGLNITIASAMDPTTIIATDKTNDDGEWSAFVDPGIYILKISGTSLGTEFNKVFRIKVDDTGSFRFEDITKNVATINESKVANNGSGTVVLTDYVKDRHGNPIIDVQVNAYIPGTALEDKNIIAQDYTSIEGKWTLKLNPGTYVIEYYHPEFVESTENRTV